MQSGRLLVQPPPVLRQPEPVPAHKQLLLVQQ